MAKVNPFAQETVQFVQNFKVVKKAGHPKLGQTRDSITVSFTNVNQYIDEVEPSKVHRILNEAIVQYGKKLILENTDDWNYVPSPEQLTLDSLYDDLTSVSSRARILTNKNIESWSVEFASIATLEGKSQAYISTVIALAKERFARLAGKENEQRLANVASFISDIDSEFRDQLNAAVNGRIIDLITDMIESGMNELTLDSLD